MFTLYGIVIMHYWYLENYHIACAQYDSRYVGQWTCGRVYGEIQIVGTIFYCGALTDDYYLHQVQNTVHDWYEEMPPTCWNLHKASSMLFCWIFPQFLVLVPVQISFNTSSIKFLFFNLIILKILSFKIIFLLLLLLKITNNIFSEFCLF